MTHVGRGESRPTLVGGSYSPRDKMGLFVIGGCHEMVDATPGTEFSRVYFFFYDFFVEVIFFLPVDFLILILNKR